MNIARFHEIALNETDKFNPGGWNLNWILLLAVMAAHTYVSIIFYIFFRNQKFLVNTGHLRIVLLFFPYIMQKIGLH